MGEIAYIGDRYTISIYKWSDLICSWYKCSLSCFEVTKDFWQTSHVFECCRPSCAINLRWSFITISQMVHLVFLCVENILGFLIFRWKLWLITLCSSNSHFIINDFGHKSHFLECIFFRWGVKLLWQLNFLSHNSQM